MKKNDIFHFRHHPTGEQGFDARTWAFEGLLIACETAGGMVLRDMYWSLDGRDGQCFCEKDANALGELEFICNLDDIEKIDSYEAEYYADNDVVFLHTQNACVDSCRYFYKRKGAQRNQEKMLAIIDDQIKKAKRDIENSVFNIQLCCEKRHQVESGNLSMRL